MVLEFERVRVSCPDCFVRMEYLDWLVRNPRYTARYALHVGALCRKPLPQGQETTLGR